MPVADFNDIRLPDYIQNIECFATDQSWLYLGTRWYNEETEQGEMTIYRNGVFEAYAPEAYIVIPYEIEPFTPYHLLVFVPDGNGGAFVYGQHDPLENADLFTLEKYDDNGNLLWSKDYVNEELQGKGAGFSDGAAGPDGSLYLYSSGKNGKILSFDPDGNVKASNVSELDSLEGVLVTEDGKLYGYGYVDEKQYFETLAEGGSGLIASPVDFRKAFEGEGGNVCLCSGTGLWEYNPETADSRLLWNWDDEYVQMVGESVEFLCYADGSYHIMNRVQNVSTDYMKPLWRRGQTLTFVTISFRDRADYPGKEVITLARANSMLRYAFSAFMPDSANIGLSTWTEDLVRMYNRQSKKYYVKMVSEGEGLNSSEKLNRVEMQIMQGEGPDLLEVSGVYAPYMVEKGMLEDLTEYYNASSAINLEDLLPQIREAGASNGMNVLVMPAFSITTWISKDPVPLKEWTPWKFLERCQESQLFYVSDPYESYSRCSRLNLLNRFVDYEAKKCHFDSAEFAKLLEECRKVPSKTVQQNVLSEAEYLMIEDFVSSMHDFAMHNESYGKDCHQGMPGWEGAGHLMNVYDTFAMNKKSKNKDGAWDFLEFLLSKNVQDGIEWGFPVRTDSFDKYLKRSYVSEENSDDEIFVRGHFIPDEVEEEDFEALRKMVASSVYVPGNSRDMIWKIVNEEVSMFFKGDAGLEQTVEKIQNRVSLYLDEM